MVTEYIRYRIASGSGAAFEAAYRRASVPLSGAPECVDYELSRCAEEACCYILRITWTSKEDHLDSFRRSAAFRSFFAEIRDYVDAIEEMRHYVPTGISGRGSAIPTLFDWVGGTDALTRLCEVFYARVGADELLAPVFADMPAEHPRFVALWLAEVFGGPDRYSTERGGHPGMLGKHLGKAITEEQRRRWVDLLVDAADETGLPADPEFRAAFLGYLEWGTRMAVLFSRPGAEPDMAEPMPSWGWGERTPWLPATGAPVPAPTPARPIR
ncbi:group II truncated hemoglobin [Sciscionella sediminilitoris]|uniref:group II truncated hemoglobin n=1 Tax=Sciscionella sediminilitoris TaxID=1445613 RepID=UPI00056CA053|nr:antibiotic biosynthesis monooxygenase [Sciscionella sp. SE31]